MPAQLVFQMVVNALVLGTVYMLMASGLTLIYGIMHQINMAHGVFFMLGAMLTYFATKVGGLPYFASLALVIVLFPLVGMVFERVVFRPIRHLWLAGYMSTIGVWILVEGLAWQFLGTEEKGLAFPVEGTLALGSVRVSWSKVLICLLALLAMAAVWWIVTRTSLGRQLRAVEQQPRAAELVGVDTNRVMAVGFALGITLAAVAGGLVSTLYSISPTSGETPMLKAFIIIILGGLGSVTGSAIAAYILGFIESFGGTLIGAQAGHFVGFALVILILIFRPAGILGHE